MVELTGWYETEQGAVLIDVEGETLAHCIEECIRMDEDFGHTDFEVSLFDGEEHRDVTRLVYRMITCYDG